MRIALNLAAVLLLAVAALTPVSASTGGESTLTGYATTDNRGRQFARLVFDRAAIKPYNVGLDGRELILLFERPVSGDFRALARSLRIHVSRVRVTAKGRILAMTLRTDYVLTQGNVDGALLIDLMPVGAVPPLKRRVVKAKPKKHAKPIKSAATSGEIWERAISKAMKKAPGKREKKKLPKVTMMPPKPKKKDPDAVAAGKVLEIEPAAGTGTVIELPPLDKETVIREEEKRAAEKKAAEKKAAEKETEEKKAPDAPLSGREKVIALPKAPPKAEPTEKAPPKVMPAERKVEEAPPPAKMPPSIKPPLDGPVRVRYTQGRSDTAFSLHFDWPRLTTAAVFQREGHLWIVFGAKEEMEFAAARAEGGTIGEALEQLSADGGTVVRLPVDRPLTPYVRREGTIWTIDLMRGVAEPSRPVRVLAEPGAAGGGRVRVFADGPGAAVRIIDPGSSEDIRVIPVAGISNGVVADRAYPQFRILATAQGIALQLNDAGLIVTPGAEAVSVAAAGGLRFEKGGVSPNYPQPLASKKPIFEFAKWRRGGFEKFTETKQKMQADVASAKEKDRDQKRLELAQFYFANGFAAEALGALNLIDPNAEMAKDPKFLMLRGAAAAMANNAPTAAGDLYPSTLDGHPELALWRGSVRAYQGNWEEANREFGRAGDLFGDYAEPYRTRFILLAARASLHVRDHVQAARYLDLIDEKSLARPQATELKLVRGMIKQAEGSTKAALKSWDEVINTRQSPARVQAVLAKIDLLTEQGKMSAGEAIDMLERLRFTWRGDALEFETLRRLGRYYTVTRQHKLALLSWRRATQFFPGHPDTPALRKKMEDTFIALFRDGMADEMPPLTAVALFEEFRALVPKNADGERMVQAFAERLVAVDLLNRAGDILEAQLRKLPSGPDRAMVGARLAEIRLLDAQPERGLTALDFSKTAGLSEDLTARRAHLRARAYIETEKYDKALAALSGDLSREAAVLRGDIHWRRQDWKQAAAAFGLIAATIEPAAGVPLTEGESQLVLGWAASLALSDDRKGLQALRRRFDARMEKGPHKDTYRVFAAAINGPVTDYEAVITRLREVDHFQAYIEAYRKEAEAAAKKARDAEAALTPPPPKAPPKKPDQQAIAGN